MQLVHTLAELRHALRHTQRPAFVATMGNLHAGHLALLAAAKPLGDVTVASIFVNRLQFLPHEDFDSYPRTLDDDRAQLEAAGCDVLFAPCERDLYPEPQTFKVVPDPALADLLEGQFRPGFFTGVCTVVMKLFNAVFAGTGGGAAIFGKKDYQQLMLIRRMVQQFAMPIDVVSVDTARSDDGLALSSRNGYLSAAERQQAVALSQALAELARAVRTGTQSLTELEAQAMQTLQAQGWAPDYMTVRQRTDLQPPPDAHALRDGPLVVLGAARLGQTRLIDNLEF